MSVAIVQRDLVSDEIQISCEICNGADRLPEHTSPRELLSKLREFLEVHEACQGAADGAP